MRCILTLAAAVLASVSKLTAASLGDPAAPLEIAEWVKGEPVDLAEMKGKKIVVVEFWATWCGPCKKSIPHLTEMQRKFQDRDVIFIGVSDEPVSKVKSFVDNLGEEMDYTVAVDRDRKTTAGYMGAFGKNGIPQAFIVDREGRVAWEGHPMGDLEKTLDRLVAMAPSGTANAKPAKEPKRIEAQRKLRAYADLAASGAGADKLDPLGAQLLVLDQELGGIEPGRKLDLTELKRNARFQALARDYQRAAAAGKSEAELRGLEQAATPFAPAGFDFSTLRVQFSLQRLFQDYYREVTTKADPAKLEQLAQRLEAAPPSDVDVLNEAAWTLLTDDRIKRRDAKLAMKLAQSAFDASGGKEPSVVDTYARALFDNGRTAEAVEQQKRAIELAEDADKKAEMKETLKRYQSKAGSAQR